MRAGEIVGLAGGGGSGKIEVAETIVGLRAPPAGTVDVDGRRAAARQRAGRARRRASASSRRTGTAQGFVPLLSIAENVTMTVPERLGPAGLSSTRAGATRWPAG